LINRENKEKPLLREGTTVHADVSKNRRGSKEEIWMSKHTETAYVVVIPKKQNFTPTLTKIQIYARIGI
jgi:hypothetical protein